MPLLYYFVVFAKITYESFFSRPCLIYMTHISLVSDKIRHFVTHTLISWVSLSFQTIPSLFFASFVQHITQSMPNGQHKYNHCSTCPGSWTRKKKKQYANSQQKKPRAPREVIAKNIYQNK